MDNAEKMAQVLLDEVRQNFASVVWTHKIQEKQADIYASRYKMFETCNNIFAGFTSCGGWIMNLGLRKIEKNDKRIASSR